MNLESIPLGVVAVLFLSTLVRATFGFGDALLAMPLLALMIEVRTATPLVALVASTIAITVLIKRWRSVRIQSAWRLIVATLLGIPLGLAFLKGVHEDLIKVVLAFVIIAFSGYNLIQPKGLSLKSEHHAFPFGFFAGILGGAYNTNGPLAVIYGTLRRWEPESFHATLQGYFLPTGLLIVAGHGISGLWTPTVFEQYLFALPAVLAAIFLGTWLNRRVPGDRFHQYVNVLLLGIGIFLLVRSI
ncbi:MAG: sulfite exporter TauE/SafE family protein [Planctomycetota bacterium]|jgi:uncharacterized membrane protein YfcA